MIRLACFAVALVSFIAANNAMAERTWNPVTWWRSGSSPPEEKVDAKPGWPSLTLFPNPLKLSPLPTPQDTLQRWNAGTKEFVQKTRQALTPPSVLPSVDSVKVWPFRQASSATSKPRTILPSFRSSKADSPDTPPTITDWLGQPRPE